MVCRFAARLLAASLIASCVLPPVSTGGAAGARALPTRSTVGSGYGLRNDQQRIGSFSRIAFVAAARRYVFAASADLVTGGIAVYDRWRSVWLPPLTAEDGFTDQQITTMAGDPVEEALWVGVPGAVLLYRPETEQLQRTVVTGVPEVIVFDRGMAGDALVRSAGRWTRISRLGLTTPADSPAAASVIVPRSAEQLARDYPQLRMSLSGVLRSQQANRPMRRQLVVSATASPDRASELWLGTDSDGLVRYDPTMQEARPLPFGLLEPGVGALALAADGVWAAGAGMAGSARSGLTFASDDLQRWRWIEGTITTPLRGRTARALMTRGARAWIAYDDGLVRVALDGDEAMREWTRLHGLEDARILALAPRGEGVFVGTPRGVQFVTDSAGGQRARNQGVGPLLLPNIPALALQLIGDTLWVGTPQGLVAIANPNGTATVVRSTLTRRMVRTLAWTDSVLVAGTDDALWQLHPRRTDEPVRSTSVDPATVGQQTRLAIDAQAVVMTGTRGILIQQRRTQAVRLLRESIDLSGPVLDVAMHRASLWFATPNGLLRFRRGPDGMVR